MVVNFLLIHKAHADWMTLKYLHKDEELLLSIAGKVSTPVSPEFEVGVSVEAFLQHPGISFPQQCPNCMIYKMFTLWK